VPLLGMVAATAAETDYPARPVRVIVPYPAGGGADTVSRILLAKLSDGLGQQFVIENRGGAGGTIGAAVAAKAERDGYTVLYDATAFSVNPSLYARLPYDTLNDFQPVFLASLVPNLLVVHPSVDAKTVEDVIAIAKAAPGGLDWASSGNGTVQHLSLELFRLRTGVKLNHATPGNPFPLVADTFPQGWKKCLQPAGLYLTSRDSRCHSRTHHTQGRADTRRTRCRDSPTN
jgi:tripartite-type tricarboxylate transporter receptor subunit TctC